MPALVVSHYLKAATAAVLRFAVTVALSLVLGFVVLAAQFGGLETAAILVRVWLPALHAHLVARDFPIAGWWISVASMIAAGILFGPLLLFAFTRWRHKGLLASALLPDQSEAISLSLDAPAVFPVARAILRNDPTLYRLRADAGSGSLTARSMPFARRDRIAHVDAGNLDLPAHDDEPAARVGPETRRRRLARMFDIPYVGAPRRIVSIRVLPEGNGSRVEVRSRFHTLLPVVDACARNRRTVEAIVAMLVDRAPRLIAERRAREERAQIEQRLLDARLQVLRAQIEPHFLYNTLANVQYLIRHDAAAADAMVGELIAYLRHSLPRMRSAASTVGGELALARAYLNVLRIRMGERLSFAIDAALELDGHAFPPMMLMSLVENAVKHGLEPKPGKGSLVIAASAVGDALRVEVRDDGVGFSAAGGSGIGLKNARETLASMFGERGRLSVEPNAGGGVTAAIEVPLVASAATTSPSLAAA